MRLLTTWFIFELALIFSFLSPLCSAESLPPHWLKATNYFLNGIHPSKQFKTSCQRLLKKNFRYHEGRPDGGYNRPQCRLYCGFVKIGLIDNSGAVLNESYLERTIPNAHNEKIASKIKQCAKRINVFDPCDGATTYGDCFLSDEMGGQVIKSDLRLAMT